MPKASTSRPTKRVKLTIPKQSNRPTYAPSSSSEDEEDDDDDDSTEATLKKEQMILLLEKHQRELLGLGESTMNNKGKGKQVEEKVIKSIWEMEEDDFDDGEAESEEDSEEEAVITPAISVSTKKLPTIISFSEPRATSIGTNRDMRSFMSAKVKNSRPTFSVADEINQVRKGKEKKSTALDNTEEEAHLATLDSTLSEMIRPLTAPTTKTTHSQLPNLLLALPTAPTKLLKGLTPLPVNAPRTLRRGQSKVNLIRAKGRDEANGILIGGKGREAKSLNEKRKLEGNDKRERGMNSTFGKLKGGGIYLSKEEISLGSGDSGKSNRGGGKGGRGGGKVRSQGGGRGRLERK